MRILHWLRSLMTGLPEHEYQQLKRDYPLTFRDTFRKL